MLAALCIADALFFPGEMDGGVGIAFLVSGTPIFAALVAGAAIRLRGSTLGLMAILLTFAIALEALWIAAEIAAAVRVEAAPDRWSIMLASFLFAAALIWFGHARRSTMRRNAAIALVGGTCAMMAAIVQADEFFWYLSAQARSLIVTRSSDDAQGTADTTPDVALDRLWESQPALVDDAVNALRPGIRGRRNVYAIAVAAEGAQDLFSREAGLALKVAAVRFGQDYRGGVLLSNAGLDLLRTPLATRTNVATTARALGDRIAPDRDVAFLYLASHGSPAAWLSAGLPRYRPLAAISSVTVADALAQAGIKRRIIVVSACFAASWIPALADDDTIVMAAAAKNRTSFGCDDRRRLTFFGQALLEGPLARGASLKSAFETARGRIARWEMERKLIPSQPQAFVGANMQDVWTEPAQR